MPEYADPLSSRGVDGGMVDGGRHESASFPLAALPLAALPQAALPLDVTAALVGTYRWIESALHAALGSWVRHVPLPAVQVHLDGQSMRHAWHAELWAERLPVLRDVDPDALTVPSPASAALFAMLNGDSGPDGDAPEAGPPGVLPLLAGLYRVALPRLVTTYGRHLDLMAPVADAPLRRTLRQVLADEVEDLLVGERLVERLLARPHDVEAVHDFTRRLETAVVAVGGGPGLVALPVRVPGE